VYANAILPETLLKCTKNGKRFMPEGAKLISFGPNYTVHRTGRKKDVVLSPDTVKVRPVSGKGTKIAPLGEVVK